MGLGDEWRIRLDWSSMSVPAPSSDLEDSEENRGDSNRAEVGESRGEGAPVMSILVNEFTFMGDLAGAWPG